MKKKEQQQESESKSTSSVLVLSCTCTHTFQDSKYGAGKRLYNLSGAKGARKARCTVCAKVVTL